MMNDLVISNHAITQSRNRKIAVDSGEETLPQMHEKKELLQFPIEEAEYQPDPSSLAGFIAGMSERVDELLAAANWRSSFE